MAVQFSCRVKDLCCVFAEPASALRTQDVGTTRRQYSVDWHAVQLNRDLERPLQSAVHSI